MPMPTTAKSRRLATAVVAAAAVALIQPAGASAPKPGLQVNDPVGDANGINGQFIGLPLPSTSTSPASVSGADIASIDFKTDFTGKGKKRKPYGFDVTLKLAAPLQKGVLITMTMDTSTPCGDTSTIQLGFGTETLVVCQSNGGTTNDTIGSAEASADGKAVTWTIDPVIKSGTTITNIYASTSVFVAGVFDEAKSSATFHYGK